MAKKVTKAKSSGMASSKRAAPKKAASKRTTAKTKKTFTVEEKNKIVNKEIKDEREHPEKIIKDTLKADKDASKEPDDYISSRVDKRSGRFLVRVITVIIVVIAAIMLVPKMATYISDESGKYMYNGFTFTYDDSKHTWFIAYKVEDYIFPMDFRYDPRSVDEIPIDIDKNMLVGNKAIYLVIDPINGGTEERKMGIAAIEIVTKISNFFNIATKTALSEIPADVAPENYDPETMPIINCSASSPDIGVVIFRFAEETAVYQSEGENCYFIEGPTGDDLIRGADRVVYNVLGIIKE